MLKFLRKYKPILLVGFVIVLMVAFLLPQAIEQIAQERANPTVLRIGHRKLSARDWEKKASAYEALNELSRGTIALMGISEGPEQWILLTELAARGGYVGGGGVDDMLREIGTNRAYMRLRAEYPTFIDQIINNPALASFLSGQIEQEVEMVKLEYPNVIAKARLTEEQFEEALGQLRGVQRMIRAYSSAARVSTPRAILRAERELEGAQIEYIFISADRRVPDVPEPDDATLQAFMEQYKDVRPGEGEYGIGYLLPPRVKIEYLAINAKGVADKITPDLREVRKRYNATDKSQTFDEARERIEGDIKQEIIEKVMAAAHEAVRARVSRATLKLEDDGQFKILPPDWESRRPKMADIAADIVKHVEEKTRPEPGKPGITIDPPVVVVKDTTFLTADDLNKLDQIGFSFIQRGQRQLRFSDYVLNVRELQDKPQINLQVGLPNDEPLQDVNGSVYFFTVLDTRRESTPKSIDEIREKLTADWKKVQAYKLLVEQDAEALLQQARAQGVPSLDPIAKQAVSPDSPPQQTQVKYTRVTRASVQNGDPNVSSDTFRMAVIDAAEKLDPLKSIESYSAEDRTIMVPLPQKLGIAIAKIRLVTPLTEEDFRGQQNRLVMQYQLEEFRSLQANPFSLARLRQRLNVKRMGEEDAAAQLN